MMHSLGKSLGAVTDETIFTVPHGYVAHVSLVFITNTSGATKTYTISWKHYDNGDYLHTTRFGYGKSLSSGASDQFSQGTLVMKSGDSMIVTTDGSMDFIVTFDLLQAQPLYTFAGE